MVTALLLVGFALAAGVFGWFGDGSDTSAGPTPTTSSSPAPSDAPGPGGATEPTDGATQPDGAGPTVADLQAHLSSLVQSSDPDPDGRGRMSYECRGSGAIGAGSAVRCVERSTYKRDNGSVDITKTPLYVAVLDDNGRYSAQLGGAEPSDYPKGTIDCRTLMAPPPGQPPQMPGLWYPTLLYYWMAAGRPASMDDDGNGLPCETVYPAEIVARAADSPLVPGNNPGVAHTVADVAQHLQAVLNVMRVPNYADAARVELGPGPDPGAPAITGTPIRASDFSLNGGVLVTVLGDDGRYAFSNTRCCGYGPNVGDYPPDASCKQLSQPLPKPELDDPSWPEGLAYPFVVYHWMEQGSPARLDKDGNGRPCEAQHPSGEVAAYFGSQIQP